MFLITTADKQFWRRNEPLLLLGEWCKLYADRHYWAATPHEVLPYHWEDREQLYRDHLYLDALGERVLRHCVVQLNALHGVVRSERYWRIILGPWIYCFLCLLYDHYQCVLTAERSGKVSHTLIGRYDPTAWVMRDMLDLARCGGGDAYNQYIFSTLLRARRQIPFEEHTVADSVHTYTNRSADFFFMHGLKRRILAALHQIGQWIPPRLNRVVLLTSSLSFADQARLQVLLGQIPYAGAPFVESPPVAVNWRLRQQFNPPVTGDAFERLLWEVLPTQLPSVYLEGYRAMHQRALAAFPRRPRVIFNACSYEVDEGFKFWAAHQVEQGSLLVGTQHGFNYGITKWFQEEDHQIRSYDRFYTWGWTSDVYPNTQPLPAAKFNRVRQTVKPASDGHVLFVTYAFPRYAYKMFSVPMAAAGMLAYFQEQFRFARSLSAAAREALLVRLFPNDREWAQRERWQEAVPEVACYQGFGVSMFAHMQQSRLLVTAPNGTPAVEAFAADFPTVLFCNPQQFEVRPAAVPLFDALRQAGILYDTPEAAAAHVERIFADPMRWWRQPTVQEAKGAFCRAFAVTSPHWLQVWAAEMRALLRLRPKRESPADEQNARHVSVG